MGCSGSKLLEELEAVSLCRDRTDLLADAIRHRYALADAHAAYAHSLRSLSSSLHRLILHSSSSPSSPQLPLPPQRKGDPASNSHIQFHSSDSDSDDDDDNDDLSPFHSDDGDDHHHHHHLHRDDEPEPEPVIRLHYARNQPPPNSVIYSHRPHSPPTDTVHFASHSYADPYGYEYYGGGGGFFGSFPPNLPPHASSFSAAAKPAAAPPPPPPPAPRASTWDFLNPFEAHESYYPPYTPSRTSNEVRDAEGIPDLEDEEHEVIKEVYGGRNSSTSTSTSSSSRGSSVEHVKEQAGPAGAVDEADDVVEKNVVAADQQRQPQVEEVRNAAAAVAQASAPVKQPRRFLDVSEIGGEIMVQGDRAFSSAMEISGVLEVGKHPYHHHHRSAVYKVPAVMTCVMPPSNEDFMNFEEDMERSSKNLSSTLQKLYIWEKKLQDEVRAEEKMRLLYDRNCKKLKRLDERGAEAHKLDEAQKLIRKLSTKIRIAIQVVNSVATKVNKLRDEELWPQIKELIQGLVRMWKTMLECHQIQCEAISEAKGLDSIASGGRPGEKCLEAMMQLELELLRWIGNFSAWINAQKNYVKAINGWLILCLHYEPEVTADGIPPYSPGRIGAPPVFVICNYWSQALDRLPEKEVIDVMQAFATNLRCLWEQHSVGQHQQLMPNTEMDMWVKAREREAQIMHREVNALNKKLVLVSGQDALPSQNAESSSLHLGLRQVFEAMENFTANSLKAYEELHMHSEE